MNDLIEKELSERGLTPKQEAFVHHLFNDANFDPGVAKKMAGYAKTYSASRVMAQVGHIIEEEMDAHLKLGGVQGVGALIDVLRDPTKPGNRERIQAANSLLDRIGKTKEAAAQTNIKVEISPVVYLPDKKDLEMTKEEYKEAQTSGSSVPINREEAEDIEVIIVEDDEEIKFSDGTETVYYDQVDEIE